MMHDNYFVYTNKSSKYAYVPLLKNAHSWGEKTFANICNFTRTPLDLSENKQYIIFLRDPIDRWLSGIPQYLENLYNLNIMYYKFLGQNFVLDPLHIDIICTKVDIETHTKKQNDAINFLLRYPCFFFYVNDEKFEEKLTHFLISKMDVPKHISLPKKINTTIRNSRKERWRKQLEQALDTNKVYKDNVMLYYKDDFDLIESVKFYKGQHTDHL